MQNNYPPCDYCKAELDYMPWHGSGLTVKQFRLAWEVLNGKSALLGKEGEA